MRERWYDSTADETVKKLNTDATAGLSRKESASRLGKYGQNEIYSVEKAPLKRYLAHVVTDLMAILLLVTAVIAAVFEDSSSALTILAILLFNYTVSIFAYVKSRRVLEEMGRYALPSAKVIRDGKLFLVKQEKLVPGDIIILCAGDIVPADSRLLTSDSLTVLETGICDSNAEARKNADFVDNRTLRPENRVNMVFASTIVTGGKGKACVVKTGKNALVSTLGKNRKISASGKLGVIEKIEKYCSAWGLIMTVMVFMLTLLNIFIGQDEGIFNVFFNSLSLAVSSMSELIVAFAYIILACGIFSAVRSDRNINSGALIKNSSKIESIKGINCLVINRDCIFSERDACVDFVYVDGEKESSDARKSSDGLKRIIRYALISTGLYGSGTLVLNNERSENVYTPEEEAIISEAMSVGIYDRSLDEQYQIIEHMPAGGSSLFDTTLIRYQGDGVVVLRGDPGAVLARCNCYIEKGKVLAMSPAYKNDLIIAASKYMRGNYKVLAVASRNTTYTSLRRIGALQSELVFEGFVCIMTPLVPEAAKNISKCRAAGIKIVLFCDKHEENNKNLAVSTGIAADESECVCVSELQGMNSEIVRTNVTLYSMYEGLSLQQKCCIVRWLKNDHGYRIGVVGSDLNDIALFNEGDVGYTEVMTLSGKATVSGIDLMSRDAPVYVGSSRDSTRSGCEALKFVSDVIVSKADSVGNGGFNSIVNAISVSKNIYLNLLHMVRYLLTSQFARFFLVLWCAVSGIPMLSASQVVFLGLITDLLAVIIIAFQRPPSDILLINEKTEEKLSFLPKHNAKMIVFALLWAAAAFNALWLGQKFGIPLSPAQTSCGSFITYIMTSWVVLAEITRTGSLFSPGARVNTIFLISLAATSAAVILAFVFPGFGALIGVVGIPNIAWLSIVIPPMIMFAAMELYKMFFAKGEKKRPEK